MFLLPPAFPCHILSLSCLNHDVLHNHDGSLTTGMSQSLSCLNVLHNHDLSLTTGMSLSLSYINAVINHDVSQGSSLVNLE